MTCIHSQPLSCCTNGEVMERAGNYVGTRAHFSVLSVFVTCCKKRKKLSVSGWNNIFCCYLLLCVSVCVVGVSTACSAALTSKQYSCPRMLECTGLMMASSSRVRSSASAALLGDSRDSWEWDSLKLCIKRVLGGEIVVVTCGERKMRRRRRRRVLFFSFSFFNAALKDIRAP